MSRLVRAPELATSRILLVALVWLSACNGPGGISSTPTGTAVVTGQLTDAPAGCGVQDVAQRLIDFSAALNRQDAQLADAFFSEKAPFAWYSAPGGEPTAIYAPNELTPYFEQRFAQHEQLNFRTIQVNGWEAARGVVHFQFTLDRRADDLHAIAAGEVTGKGALHCATQTFVVISIGDA